MATTYRRNLFELLVLGIPTPPGSTMAARYQFQKAYGESGFATATVEVGVEGEILEEQRGDEEEGT